MKKKKVLSFALLILLTVTPFVEIVQAVTTSLTTEKQDVETSDGDENVFMDNSDEKDTDTDVPENEGEPKVVEEETTVPNEDSETKENTQTQAKGEGEEVQSPEENVETQPQDGKETPAFEYGEESPTLEEDKESPALEEGEETTAPEEGEEVPTPEEEEETQVMNNMISLKDNFIKDSWLENNTVKDYEKLFYDLSERYVDIHDEKREEIIIVMNQLSSYINNEVDYLSDKFQFIAQLNESSLHGALAKSYQMSLNNKRGLVAWYYGKLNALDYILNMVHLATSETLMAIRYIPGDATLELNEFSNIFERFTDKAKKVVYRGYIVAPETNDMLFDVIPSSGDKQNLGLSLKISELNTGVRVSKSDKTDLTWKASLEKGKLYELVFSVEVKQSKDNLPESAKLMWSSSTMNKQVISDKYLLADKNNRVDEKTRLQLRDVEPFKDADKDGIPNSWETNGYVVKGATLLAFDPDVHDITEMHRSSPVNKSTDGDPYSDLEEALGKEIGVSGPGSHELIAAYPQVIVSLRGFDVSLKTTNTITKSTSTNTLKVVSKGNKNTLKTVTDRNTTKETTQGVSLAVTQGMAYKNGTASYVSAGSTSVSAGYTYKTDDAKTDYVVNVADTQITDEVKKTEMEKLISTSNTIQAATLSLELQAENIGNVPVYNMTPNVSIIVGDNVVKTFDLAQTFDLAVGETKAFNNQTITLLENGSRQLNLTINKEVLQQILNGAPVQVQTNRLNGEILIGRYNSQQTRGSWEDYTNQVNGVTATIHHEDVISGLKTYKVYAPQKGAVGTSPMTLPLALELIYGNGFVHNEDGISINGVPLSGIFFTADDPDVIREFNNSIEKKETLDLDAITLRPGMSIHVETSTDDATKPLILNTFYKYGKISATVLGNLSPVDNVKAEVKIDGEVRTIAMSKVPGSKTRFEFEFDDVPYIDVDFNNRVIAEDENGNSNNQKLYISDILFYREQIERKEFGYGFELLDNEIEIKSKSQVKDYFRNNGNSPLMIRYTYTKPYEDKPVTVIVNSESDINNLRDPERSNDYHRAYIVGKFVKNSNTKLMFVNGNQNELYVPANQGKSISTKVYTGETNAKGFLIAVGKSGLVKNDAGEYHMIINGKKLKVYTSAEKDANNYIMMVPADKNNPDCLNVFVEKVDSNNQRFAIQVIGYVTDEVDKGYYYKGLSSKIALQTIDLNGGTKNIDISDKISGLYNPKYLVLEVRRENSQSNLLKVVFNGKHYYFGTQYKANGKRYVVIPMNQENINTLNIEMFSDSGASGNMHLSVVGYYY